MKEADKCAYCGDYYNNRVCYDCYEKDEDETENAINELREEITKIKIMLQTLRV